MSEAEEAKAATPAFDKLGPKQKKFVLGYLLEFNATKAYIDAEYSPKSARANAHRMRTKESVAAAIAELMPRLGLTADRVKSGLAEIAFGGDVADLEDFLLAGKTLKNLRAEGFNTKLIKGLKIRREVGGTKDKPVNYEHVSVDLHDRLGALREAGRVLGIVTEKHQVDVTGEGLRGLTESELLARGRAAKPEDDGG